MKSQRKRISLTLWVVASKEHKGVFLGRRAVTRNIMKAATFPKWDDAYRHTVEFLGEGHLAGWEIIMSAVPEHCSAFLAAA